MNVAYVRVSTAEQNEERQGIAIAKAKGKYKDRKKITREKFKI